MAATLVAARGAGPLPAWGPEAITPDWENQEVSTGVRRGSEFRRCVHACCDGRIKPERVGRIVGGGER